MANSDNPGSHSFQSLLPALAASLSPTRTCILVLTLAMTLPTRAALNQSSGSIDFRAEEMQADLVRNELVMQQVVIAQDGYTIRADQARANGIDFKNSEWTFSGKVNITTPTGASRADQAIVRFVQEAISELRITGEPATFQNNLDGQQLAQGQANRIDYDLTRQQIRLSDNAWFKYGQIEYKGRTVLYDLGNNRIIADRNEQQGERLQITVTPEKSAGNSPDSSSP